MFTGIQSYGATYGGRPYHREMGETLADMEKAVKYQEGKEAKEAARNYSENYRPREMGEKPEDVLKTGSARNTYSSSQVRDTSGRPREMGEDPAEVAKSNEARNGHKEMTEQEKRLDMYA